MKNMPPRNLPVSTAKKGIFPGHRIKIKLQRSVTLVYHSSKQLKLYLKGKTLLHTFYHNQETLQKRKYHLT